MVDISVVVKTMSRPRPVGVPQNKTRTQSKGTILSDPFIKYPQLNKN